MLPNIYLARGCAVVVALLLTQPAHAQVPAADSEVALLREQVRLLAEKVRRLEERLIPDFDPVLASGHDHLAVGREGHGLDIHAVRVELRALQLECGYEGRHTR